MSKIKHTDLIPEVTAILTTCANRKESGFVTAYQILNRMDAKTRATLEDEHGPAGKGSGDYVSAATIVSLAARAVENVEVIHLDCRGLAFTVGDHTVAAGFDTCGAYRIAT